MTTFFPRWLILVALAVLLLWWLRDDEIVHGPGVVAAQTPVQTDDPERAAFEHEGYRITPLAQFGLTARVLRRENYTFDREADLSPVDLALGWGPMSDEQVLQHIEISQRGRWYYWRAQTLPIARREIERHSANMHLIPADPQVAEAIDDIRTGHVVELQG